MIKKVLGKAGSQNQEEKKQEHFLWIRLRKIAEDKLEDLNTDDVEQAMKVVAGTARSMGVEVK